MRFLPANCIITPEDEQEILLYKEAGLNVREIIRVMELKKNVKHGGLSFLDKDIHNLFTKVRRVIGGSDAMNLIEYMRSLKQKDVKFRHIVPNFILHILNCRPLHQSLKTKIAKAFEVLKNHLLSTKVSQEGNAKEQVDNLQRSAKDNEISMDETSINNEDILLDNMPSADNDILCPPKSIPKGRLRKGREKGGKESATKGKNRCSLCKQRGHTRPKCPQKDNIFFMVADATSTSPDS
ncbi:protein FAR1-related sequence 11 [Tanacetum coccineum]